MTRVLVHRRQLLCGLAALPVGCSLFGGGKTNADRSAAAPSEPQNQLAFQAAYQGHRADEDLLNQWTPRMWQVKYDVVPFLRAVRDAPARKKPKLGMFYAPQPDTAIGVHTWTILDDRGQPTSVVGEAAIAKVAHATGLHPDDMRIAAYVLHDLPTQIASINEHARHLRREVDTLLWYREEVWPDLLAKGKLTEAEVERARADADLALKIRARSHEAQQTARAEVFMACVLATQFVQDGAIEELEATADEVIAAGKEVHPYPSAEPFGLPEIPQEYLLEEAAIHGAWWRTFSAVPDYPGGLKSKVPSRTSEAQPVAVPTGPNAKAELEAAGIRVGGDFMASLPAAKGMIEDYRQTKATVDEAVGGAQAAMSGDIGGALEAAGKVLPVDATVGASLQTIAAATRGDIRGVLAGLDRVTKDSKIRARVRKRLARFEHLRPIVEAGVDVAKRVR